MSDQGSYDELTRGGPPGLGLNAQAIGGFTVGPPPAFGRAPQTGRLPPGAEGLISPDALSLAMEDRRNILDQRPVVRYNEGEEWRPAMLSPAAIAELQAQLVEAGLLDPDNYSRGHWDVQSANAYKRVLASANAAGITDRMALDRMRSGFTGTAKGERKRAPLTIRLTHPDDIRDLVNDVSVRLIGRYLNEEEIAPFIPAYQQLQRQFQQRYYDVTNPEGEGGEIEEPPSLETFARQRIKEERPKEVFTHTAKERFQGFMGLLSSVGGGGLR